MIFGVASYFIVGILWNKYRRGATGMEVIPNLSFWQDLPNLVKVSFYYINSLLVNYRVLTFHMRGKNGASQQNFSTILIALPFSTIYLKLKQVIFIPLLLASSAILSACLASVTITPVEYGNFQNTRYIKFSVLLQNIGTVYCPSLVYIIM